MPSRVCVAPGLLRLAAARSELIHGREWVCRESTLNPFLRGLCTPSSSLLHQLLLEVLESVKACFSTMPFLCHRVLGVWAQKLQKIRSGGDLSVQFLIVTYGRDTIQRGQSCAVRSKAIARPDSSLTLTQAGGPQVTAGTVLMFCWSMRMSQVHTDCRHPALCWVL